MTALFYLIILLPQLALANLQEPQVINSQQKQEVVLGKDVSKALKAFDPHWLLLKPHHFQSPVIGLFENYENELPQAVVADFNGDGINDILLMGMSEVKKSIVIKAILFVSSKEKNKYVGLPLDQWNAGLPRGAGMERAKERVHNLEMYLGLAEKAELKNTNIPRDRRAFKIEVYLGESTLYYYKEGAIRQVHRRFSN